MIGATGSLFDLVFVPSLCDRLPLHDVGRIGAAALQGNNVIDDEPRTRPRGPAGCRAGMDGLECSPYRRAPFNPAAAVAHAGSAPRRRRSGAVTAERRSDR